MTAPLPLEVQKTAILDRHFLDLRARLLEMAATLDRIDRAPGELGGDARPATIDAAIRILGEAGPGRAERLQQLFSRSYDPQWRRDMGL